MYVRSGEFRPGVLQHSTANSSRILLSVVGQIVKL